ncbi:MAG TPA: hypothetical protein VKX25_08150 [Bryobacteraceae bacterium]|nr:hypothetical protein [Bryobacteraceae bacterium]
MPSLSESAPKVPWKSCFQFCGKERTDFFGDSSGDPFNFVVAQFQPFSLEGSGRHLDTRIIAILAQPPSQIGEQRIDFGISLAQRLDALYAVTDRGVIPPTIETANDRGAPPSNTRCEIHSDLPIEASRLRIAKSSRRSEASGHERIDLRKG